VIQLTEQQLDEIIERSWSRGYEGALTTAGGTRHTSGRSTHAEDWETACREVGVEYDAASNEIAGLISAITGDEVDGDGDPWSIVCQHLDGVAEAIADVRRRFPDADAHLRNEYAWRDTRDPYRSEAPTSDEVTP